MISEYLIRFIDVLSIYAPSYNDLCIYVHPQ